MTKISDLDFEKIQAIFEKNDIFTNPSEIHGVISGMISGGTALDSTDWLRPVSDFFHQGLVFNRVVETELNALFKTIFQTLADDDMTFEILLPPDDESLSIRSAALAGWSQGFLSGFALNKHVMKQCSDDVNEMIHDFAEIGKMAISVDDNEENESAFNEIYEYVRVSAIMCFAELGQVEQKARGKITLH